MDARDDLAVIVMSATIDADPISRFLGGARVFDIDARAYPIDIRYRSISIAEAVRESRGDVLCFLPARARSNRRASRSATSTRSCCRCTDNWTSTRRSARLRRRRGVA